MPQRFKSQHLARHSNTPFLGRSRLMAHIQGALAHRTTNSRFPLLSVFLQSPWPWLLTYLKSAFNGRFRPYPTYLPDGHDGIYPLRSSAFNEPIRISIAADWGTGTEEASRVAEQMTRFKPDYTLHLGDVYYIGDEIEVKENFLGEKVTDNTPVKFPRGTMGTLTLPGNHEMYGGGAPYFKTVLSFCSPEPGQTQRASFFALESEHWRILGLDTGYNSTGVPILGSLPLLQSVKSIGGDAHLEPAILDWLRTNVRPRERRKATIILSHHQYFTAFPDEVFPKPAAQLHEFFDGQEVIWLWGHEHRLAIYDLFSPDDSIRCYGRCMGHGGMPVETAKPHLNRAPLTYFDARTNYDIGNGICAGWNGFVNLTMDGPRITLEYRDLTNKRLFHETFLAGSKGALTQTAESS